ncbi:MAG: CoA transferase, partial [Gammaproteobacteria bacterium]|nr:CoA transferase [Gammaproteobacteria bacterium]
SFGKDGPWKDYAAPDLIAGALGGSVAITGDVDTPPLKPFGDLNFTVSGAYVAIAALAGLRHARETGQGQTVRVSVHECIASCLEHVFMFYLFGKSFRNARNRVLDRRGSLHWTDLYEVMSAKNGHIMVTPTPSLDNQLVWLIEEEAYEDLLDPKYQDPAERGKWARRMMDVLRSWVATKDVESLFFEAQEHHAPYGWVQNIPQVAKNPQLEARDWWSTTRIDGLEIRTTGSPYRLSESPASPRNVEEIRVSENNIVELCGWGEY